MLNLTKTGKIHDQAKDCYLHRQICVHRLEKGVGVLEGIFIGKEEKHFGNKTRSRAKWLGVPENTMFL